MIEAFGVGLGTVFQLLTTIFSGGIFAVLTTFYVRNRKLSLDAEATLRTHFGDELKRLTSQVHDCEADKRRMWDEINALKDQLRQYSADRVIALGEPGAAMAPHAAASAPRVKMIVDKHDGD